MSYCQICRSFFRRLSLMPSYPGVGRTIPEPEWFLSVLTRVDRTIPDIKSLSWKYLALFRTLRVFLRSILHYSNVRVVSICTTLGLILFLNRVVTFSLFSWKESDLSWVVYRCTCTVTLLGY